MKGYRILASIAALTIVGVPPLTAQVVKETTEFYTANASSQGAACSDIRERARKDHTWENRYARSHVTGFSPCDCKRIGSGSNVQYVCSSRAIVRNTVRPK